MIDRTGEREAIVAAMQRLLDGTPQRSTGALSHTYSVGGANRAQVLRVPHYRNVTFQSGGTLTAPVWDGGTGGVLAFRSLGSFAVNSGGTVTMAGRGYRGAPTNGSGFGGTQGEGQSGLGSQSTAANGSGGGGGCSNGFGNPPGGGGGGNGTAGTAGNPGNNSNCDIPGAGGNAVGTSDLKVVTFKNGSGGSTHLIADVAGYYLA